jgi:hypothetical protein
VLKYTAIRIIEQERQKKLEVATQRPLPANVFMITPLKAVNQKTKSPAAQRSILNPSKRIIFKLSVQRSIPFDGHYKNDLLL